MILYHGSSKKFETFKISRELARHDISSLSEGYGIYLTENKEIAQGYGEILYEIEVNHEQITDFTNSDIIKSIINNISKEVGIPIIDFMDVDTVINSVLVGDISVTTFYQEINGFLDSQESFYNLYGHLVTYEDDCIFSRIERSFFNHVTDILKYFDKSFNTNIYICFRNSEKLKIINVV